MRVRPAAYLAVILGATVVGTILASPAWAAGMQETRRGFGISRVLALVCCLVVVGLVAIGLVIGLMVGRRRRGRS